MGVYTYTDNPLGLTLSPRLEKILRSHQNGDSISHEDIEYLIDESARYTTISNRIKRKDYKVTGYMLEDEVELKEVLGDLVTELDYIYASQIDEDKVYKHELTQFSPLYGKIDTLTTNQIKTEVRDAIRTVNELQKSFDDNKDNLKVVGYFKTLKKDYQFKMEVIATTTDEEVIQAITTQILPKIEAEARKKEESIQQLRKLNFSNVLQQAQALVDKHTDGHYQVRLTSNEESIYGICELSSDKHTLDDCFEQAINLNRLAQKEGYPFTVIAGA